MPEETENDLLPRMTEEQLKAFVREVLNNNIFLSSYIPEDQKPRMLSSVFMPLMLGGAAQLESVADDIGIFWEYYDKALPRSINGFPIFGSMRVMHKDDWSIAAKTINREWARLDELELEEEE